MKKLLIASLVAIAPVVASAQVSLIGGFNFGQFIGAGVASTDGTTGDPIGYIDSNYGPNNQPGIADAGVYRANNSIAGAYSAGSSRLFFDGTNGSSAWDFAGGTNVSVLELGAGVFGQNAQTVNPLIQMYPGDDNNARLSFASSAGTNQFSIVTNTTGWADFDPVAFSQPNDYNFTFAAYAVGGSGSVSFSLNGVNLGTFNVTGTESAFNMDLSSDFYGQAAASLVATVSGNVVFDNIQINGVAAAIPEPSTYAAILGALSLGFVIVRRRFQAQAA